MLKRFAVATLLASSVVVVPMPTSAAYPEAVTTTRTTPVALQYRLQRGQSARYTITGSQIREGLEGTPGNVSTFSFTIPYTWEVQSVDDAGRALVASSLTSPNLSWVVNGESEDTRGIADGILSARLTHRVSPTGSVSERSGTIDTNIVTPDAGTFLADSLAASWIEFPEQPVGIGDSWLQTVPLEMGSAGPELVALIEVRYTLTGFVGESTAVIDAVYSTQIDGTLPATTQGGRGLRVVGRGQGEGYVLFNTAAGVVNEVSLRSGMVLTATENSGRRTSQAYTSNVTLTSAASADAE
jgi:hypothetical protein